MNITAIYPKKNLSKLGKPQYKMPYLLRSLAITRPNQVWSIDITYIPMLHGFMYLTAIIDEHSRSIMAWGLHNTLYKEDTNGEIQKSSMNKEKTTKVMAFQKIAVTLQSPRKDDGETLRCCLRNGRGIEPRPFLPKKRLWLTLSVVCLAELETGCYCLNNIGVLL